jgi:hypothetical protein
MVFKLLTRSKEMVSFCVWFGARTREGFPNGRRLLTGGGRTNREEIDKH